MSNRNTNCSTSRDLKMEPIAIIGVGCRFPGADNPESFWELLRSGQDAITEVPPDRWDIDAFYDPHPGTPGKMSSRWGGFLNQVDQFDPGFFGILPRRAKLLDPQQRLVLEVAWEALENAALAPAKLAGSKTGVFIAISHNDYDRIICKDISRVNAHHGPSTYHCIAANRLSHILDLRGPSMAIDTACSSSLVALHLACQSLRTGESNLALVGGVSLILTPEETIASSHARVMAADGRCKTFDASTDGYVRGEGCGVVAIKRLADAIRDQDNILAVIKGSAVNQNGLGNGMTAFNGPTQQAVINQALENAGVTPAEISYVEVHGSGTPLGDPIEANALKTVLMRDRPMDRPCWIGSVKTNIGYLESAAAMASLIKVVLSLQNQQIPAHLHLKNLNPRISLANTPISIPTECQPWPSHGEPRRAGISAFGFGGTNSHVILEEAPQLPTQISQNQRPLHLFTLSAKNQQALRELTNRYLDYLQSHPQALIEDICFTANTGRNHFSQRFAVVTASTSQLQQQLTTFVNSRETAGLVNVPERGANPQTVGFVFNHHGYEYINLGRELYDTNLTFRQNLEQCDEILRPYLPKSILEVLYPGNADSHFLEKIYAYPAVFALEYSLAQLWRSWGIEPAYVTGYGVGEYVAACVAGVFSLEVGLKLVTCLGRLMDNQPSALSLETQQLELKTVASGANLSHHDSEGRISQVDRNFHPLNTSLTELSLIDLQKTAQAINYSTPKINLISNLTGQLVEDEIATPSYWLSYSQQLAQLALIRETFAQQGCKVLLNIGLQQANLSTNEQVELSSLFRKQAHWVTILESLRELYLLGISIDWLKFDQGYTHHRLQLPTYPFQRQRYWIETSDKLIGI